MNSTLAALEAAINANPADRTARLVYADALDEDGAPASAARAAFIRAQVELARIELESPSDAGVRTDLLTARCDELFAEHWIDWWAPVCAAAGLPAPFGPKPRLRDRVRRAVRRDRREPGAPYARTADIPGVYSVRSDELGFTLQFLGGFPEVLALHGGAPGVDAALLRNLFAHAPIRSLRFLSDVSEPEWDALEGPHLAKLAELRFDRMTESLAARAARCGHLRNLASLAVLLLRPAEAALCELVARPAWAGLRALTLLGISPPAAVRALAERGTLAELDSLTFGVGEVPEVPNFGLSGALGRVLNDMIASLFSPFPMPAGPIRWPDYWPALEALARAPVLPRLRVLRVCEGDPADDALQRLFGQFFPDPAAAEPFPDAVVMALADRLNPDKLERLELPAARLSPAARRALAARFGRRAGPE